MTRVAFVNFPGFQLARIERARESGAVRVESLDLASLDRVADHPVAYIFGRGLQLDETQLEHLREAGRRGTRLFVQGATNPALDVTNLRGAQLDAANGYLEFGGAENYARLLNFSRVELDGKAFRADPVEPPVERSMDVLFHLDDDLTFETVDAFDAYYDAQGLAKADAPRIALITSVPGPFNANRDHVDAFIRALEGRAWNVYPMAAAEKRLDFLKRIDPDLVVLMPHGRLTLGRADEAIGWLRERDIPMLTPVSVFQNHDDWVRDQQGMAGSMLTMSVVLPELDGGIAPYAVAAQFTDADGYEIFDALPERLETFCDLVEGWLELKAKPNRDKRVAIYYYKGPGKNAMNAGSLEVAPSLLNLLRSLRDAGYTVEGLPETDDEFWALVQAKGPVMGPYARGAFEEYVATGDPALVPAAEYAAWVAEDLEPGMRDAVVEQYGPAPGEYMTVGEGEETALAVARVRVRQRRHIAAAPAGRRRRHVPAGARRAEGAAAPLRGLLPVDPQRLRGRRGDALRHPRQPRVHAVEADCPVGLRLGRRPRRGPPARLRLRHEQRRRGHHRQAPLLCGDGDPPDAAVHGGRAVRGAAPPARPARQLAQRGRGSGAGRARAHDPASRDRR